ncbi:hypothetical protein QA634_24910 [Methylobacterium sp. CB376]|uniref:hypothetical protein n=1 Tax=unclassified Methylobacterium TaxID=2615210 RepID=UPI00123741FD|nr:MULTISPECIES: hypothetical protein [Methylobacterium]WFT78488.1 hypothetical protein QA634_24910 [Methylobacterium nodulans]
MPPEPQQQTNWDRIIEISERAGHWWWALDVGTFTFVTFFVALFGMAMVTGKRRFELVLSSCMLTAMACLYRWFLSPAVF